MQSSHTIHDPCITPMEKVMGVVKVQKANRQAVEPHAMSIRFIYRDGTS